ncbi:thymidylate kinase [Cyprinid herpesvirus 1]|uniref:dTMP kinase n=1 Tax=Cyprinid herpesvirus 1 TaxID=317858 RepID=K7PBK5_9VIRU|nr:thymidylate kinase [Cyprinid herpesvirus 1]AFJ20321.1 thymidylate kinase [Cyprinid herpesvirus 1]
MYGAYKLWGLVLKHITSKMKRGALVVLEGVDRAGKTTQCQKLVEALQGSGRPAELMRFPDRTTTIGKMISSYLESKTELDDHAVHLLFSANRWELVPLMKQKLERGTSLVLDRYAFSGVAFSSAKPDMPVEWCMGPDVGLPKPDLVMFLSLNPTAAETRGGYGLERYETNTFQSKVEQRFSTLIQEDSSVDWRVVDAGRTVEEVHSDIMGLCTGVFESGALSTPLGKLWCPC